MARAQHESRHRLTTTASLFSGEDRIRTPRENTGKIGVSSQSGAESGAVDAENRPDDPRLEEVIDAWGGLPDAVKAGILAMVRAAGGTG